MRSARRRYDASAKTASKSLRCTPKMSSTSCPVNRGLPMCSHNRSATSRLSLSSISPITALSMKAVAAARAFHRRISSGMNSPVNSAPQWMQVIPNRVGWSRVPGLTLPNMGSRPQKGQGFKSADLMLPTPSLPIPERRAPHVCFHSSDCLVRAYLGEQPLRRLHALRLHFSMMLMRPPYNLRAMPRGRWHRARCGHKSWEHSPSPRISCCRALFKRIRRAYRSPGRGQR